MGADFYVFAPENLVEQQVMAELSRYGHMQRILGGSPQEMCVRWAGYKDGGREFGWWFGEATRGVGWGYAEPGHNILLANPSDWRTVVPSDVLSHIGKHAMLILTNSDGTIPEAVTNYLSGPLKPTRTHPSQQVFNFAWILGAGQNISDNVMREYAGLLEVTGLRTVGKLGVQVGVQFPPSAAD